MDTHYEVIDRVLGPYRAKARAYMAKLEQGGVSPILAPAIYLQDVFSSPGKKDPVQISRLHSSYLIEAVRKLLVDAEGGDRHRYTTVTENDDYLTMAKGLASLLHTESQEYIRHHLAFISALYFHFCAFELAGKHVYEVSPGLAEQMQFTELRGLQSADLRLPYEVVYLTVPKQAGLEIWNQESGWHDVVGLYIVEDYDLGEGQVVGTWKFQEGEQVRGWRIMAAGAEKDNPELKAFDPTAIDDAVSYFRIPLPDGYSLEEIIDITADDFKVMDMKVPDDHSFGQMFGKWQAIFRWAMNVIMYATHIEPGEDWIMNKEARQLWSRIQKLPKGKKKSTLQARYRTMDPRKRKVLGKKIVVQRHVLNKGGGSGLRGPDKMQVRRRVPGHWRRVVHGPKRSLRRWQWIEPYWRHKDGIELPSQHTVR